MRGHQEALPHGIIPYQHSNNRLNEPRIIFILDNLTLNLYPQNQKPPFLRSWPPFLHFSKAQRFFVDSNASKAYLHPLIYFRIFDPTELFFMYVIFVAFGLSSLLASSRPFFEPLQILRIDGWMDGTGCIDLFFFFSAAPF